MDGATLEVRARAAPRRLRRGRRRDGRAARRDQSRDARLAAARRRLGRRALAGDAGADAASAPAAGAPTLVFDEIDAGVGGNTARAVGERLRDLGEGRQVICITHLPQVASLAATPLPDREARRGRRDPRARSRRSRARSWSPRSSACSAASAATRPPIVTRASCSLQPERLAATAEPAARAPFPIIGGRWPLRLRAQARSCARRRDRRRARRVARRPVAGPARLGRRTKDLVKRLRPGRHRGDRSRRPRPDRGRGPGRLRRAARSSTSPQSSTDRYPNAGPLLLARAGVRLVDGRRPPLFDELSRRRRASSIDGGEVRSNGTVLARGTALDGRRRSRSGSRDQRARIDEALARLRREHDRATCARRASCWSGEIELPATRTDFRDRHVLIVVRGTTYRKDLRTLRAYIRRRAPGARRRRRRRRRDPRGGIQARRDPRRHGLGLRRGARCGAELIVHAYPDGRAPGRERLSRARARPPGRARRRRPARTSRCCSPTRRARELIVSVGAHFNLTEFLDKNRAGMSSTFLTRLRIGETLVDAKGVSRLYNPGVAGLASGGVRRRRLPAADRDRRRSRSPALETSFDLIWLKIKVLAGALMGYSARYHAASLAAVFLALAIGHPDRRRLRLRRRLGRPPRTSRRASRATSTRREAQDRRARGRARARAASSPSAVYPALVADRLRGRERRA